MMKNVLFILIASLVLSCSHQSTIDEANRAPSSGSANIVYSPKLIGFIFLGQNKRSKLEVSSLEYVLQQDLERIPLNKDYSPIGDFFLKPGSIVKISKDLFMYTRPATRSGGLDLSSQVHLKAGTKIRILQYNEGSLTYTTAIVEVLD